jgi:hypothetical protein
MAMNHVQTQSQVCSRPDLDAPKIIDSEKDSRRIVRRGYDARLIGR